MATAEYFDGVLSDKKDPAQKVALKFGRSTLYGEATIYFTIDGKTVILDRGAAGHIVEAMSELGAYLRLPE